MESNPIISVCMITYNHEKYIREAIESALMQRTTFPYELVVANDCSKDNTHKIINDIINSHPKGGIIRYYKHESNIGVQRNFIFALEACRGKYIALCEGDDYWTDDNKLQKQYEFLELNKELSLSFHNVLVKNENGDDLYVFNSANQKKMLELNDIINDWNTATASIMFRREYLTIPDWFHKIFNGDYALQLILAGRGSFGYLSDIMSVYRKHSQGITSLINNEYHLKKKIELFYFIKKYYHGSKYINQIKRKLYYLQCALIYQKSKLLLKSLYYKSIK